MAIAATICITSLRGRYDRGNLMKCRTHMKQIASAKAPRNDETEPRKDNRTVIASATRQSHEVRDT